MTPSPLSLSIIGAGGHGKVVADIAYACGYRDIAFYDQAWPQKTKNGAWKIVGKPQNLFGAVACAVGDNVARARIMSAYDQKNLLILLHPSVIISPSAVIAAGTVAAAGVIVNADAQIGVGVILNTASSVDHDCTIGDYVHVSPGVRLAGNVSVGSGAWIGLGAVIREGVTIGENAMIAAGAVVVSDVAPDARVAGVPARLL